MHNCLISKGIKNTAGKLSALENTTSGFVFDVDGVLCRGAEALPGAGEMLTLLRRNSIPFAILTNSGGLTEQVRAAKLSRQLGIPGAIEERQIVQSHTPFQELANEYGDKTVLAIGACGPDTLKLAQHYGFAHAVTTSDINAAANLKVSLIAVFSTPQDWRLELQAIVDLLLSQGGVVGTRSPKNGDTRQPNYGYQEDGQPTLWFSNPDFEWATTTAHPRLAQGAFRAALEGIWSKATGGRAALRYETCGKPTATTFRHGERALMEHHRALTPLMVAMEVRPSPASRPCTWWVTTLRPTSGALMLTSLLSGGAGNLSWSRLASIGGQTGSDPANAEFAPGDRPLHIARNVKEAVMWALERERIDTWIKPPTLATEVFTDVLSQHEDIGAASTESLPTDYLIT